MMDVLEDVNRIGLQGFAGDQLVSLYRYYRKLTTPAGQRIAYSDDEVATLQAFRLGIPADKSLFASLSSTKLRLQLAGDVGLPVPEGGAGASVIPRGAPLIVTGHSLGGHLALLFGRVFPEVTERVYTYNAPGIGVQGEIALRLMGFPPNSASTVTNIASEMGAEAVSRIWAKPGENIGIATEPGHPLYQHSIVPLTDALAVYGAFAELSPSLATGHAVISGMVGAASPYPEQSLEAVLDDLRAALGVEGAPTQIATTLSDLGARDDYYENLYSLLDGRQPGHDYRIESLVGKSAAELSVRAATDVSVRFALRELQPFAVRGGDFAQFDDAFSGQWLASRAEWLQASLEGNLLDRPFGFSGDGDNVVYSDIDAGQRYAKLNGAQGILAMQALPLADRSRLQEVLDATPYTRSVVFGSNDASLGDALAGLPGADRLFGGRGGDHLEGHGGDDYLEGGEGADTLLGGEGDDVLAGGDGADRLEGGSGSDQYLFGETLDADTIADRDGSIYAGATRLTGGSGNGSGSFASSDGRFVYAFSGGPSAGGTLLVNGVLRIEGFRDGDLGIHLADAGQAPIAVRMPGQTQLLLGDSIYEQYWLNDDRSDWRNLVSVDDYGNPDSRTRTGTFGGLADSFEVFPGTPDSTHFIMGGGNDNIQEMLGGDDHLEMGDGEDAAFGGSGNDVIEGGPGWDILAGGRDDDAVFAGTRASMGIDLSTDALPAFPVVGDLLSGGDGDDGLVGNAEANLIEGGAGRDRIWGGSGDDWIGSDVAALASRERYDIHPPKNEWINRSVDVLWGLSEPPTYALSPRDYAGRAGRAWLGGVEIRPELAPDIGDGDEIDAGSGNDTIYAAGGNDRVFGGDGDDWISAGGGDDLIFGGAGDDVIDAGYGADAIYGGDGRDLIYADRDPGGQVIIYPEVDGDGPSGGGPSGEPPSGEGSGGGSDPVFDEGGESLLASGDFVDGGADGDPGGAGAGDADSGADQGNDSVVAAGDVIDAGDGDDEVIAGAGDDFVIGGSGDDLLTSVQGNDTLLGGAGQDFLSGGAGGDLLDGGPGNDRLHLYGFGDAASRVRMGRGSGLDVLEARGGPVVVDIAGDVSPQEVSVALAQHAVPAEEGPAGSLETLTGIMVSIGSEGDALFVADILPADQQAPWSIEFADGTVWDEDTLDALLATAEPIDAPLALTGTATGDLLYGTAAAETLSGAGGDDWLAGGAGNDTYVYAAGDGFDRIEDSSGGSDTLRFAAGVGPEDVGVYASGTDYIVTAGSGGLRIAGGRTQGGAIERVAFADGTSWSVADLDGRADVLPENRAPAMPAWLGSVEVDPGSRVDIAIPREAISDPDRFDALGYYALGADGEPLPEWLQFDAASLAFSGTPAGSDAGRLDVLLIAADSAGAAAVGALSIDVGGADTAAAGAPDAPAPATQSAAEASSAAAAAQATTVAADAAVAIDSTFPQAVVPAYERSWEPLDPVYQAIEGRFELPIYAVRGENYADRYLEAIREFEERRLEREAPLEAPLPDEAVEAWNSAMHDWHDRHPGFGEADLGGEGGAWSLGWGLPGPGEGALGGSSVSTPPGLASPGILARLEGVARSPALSEGLRLPN